MDISQPLTVLSVDNDPDFAELTARFLEREDDRLKVLTESNPADALELFHSHRIDCIVSDYEMPGMDGLSFLEKVRGIDENIPFILYTGKGSEEVASDAISAEVTDYFQKTTGNEQYTLLANKIRNGVAQSRAEQERQLTIDRMTDALIEVDEVWRFTTIDSRAEEIYGMDADEMLGRNVWDVFHEAIGSPFYDEYQKVMKTRDPASVEEYYDDLEFWFEVHVYPAPTGGLSIYFRDITERKERAKTSV